MCREHEDNDAEPDIWSVFEYATSIAAVPEERTENLLTPLPAWPTT